MHVTPQQCRFLSYCHGRTHLSSSCSGFSDSAGSFCQTISHCTKTLLRRRSPPAEGGAPNDTPPLKQSRRSFTFAQFLPFPAKKLPQTSSLPNTAHNQMLSDSRGNSVIPHTDFFACTDFAPPESSLHSFPLQKMTPRGLALTRLFLTSNAVNSATRAFSSSSVPLLIPLVEPDPAWASPNPSDSSDHGPAFSAIIGILGDPGVSPGPVLHSALERSGVRPDQTLISALFDRFASSPKLLPSLFEWARKMPEFEPTPLLVNSVVNALGKARDFDAAWCLVLDEPRLVSVNTFAILIRRYARVGMTRPAIRTFEYASNLGCVRDFGKGEALLEILLDALSKEGRVKSAAEYVKKKMERDPCWVPSVRVYNILLHGWLRVRKLKHAERLWSWMNGEGRGGAVMKDVVSYGTMVEGYCRMGRVERAIELVFDMRKEGIEPNVVVFNPIIDALAEAGRFEEVSRMMERFMLCESGPNISTYNSLVKGYCKAGDVDSASKVLKTMINKDIFPTAMTYNYFFKCYAKRGKVEDGMNLYSKMIESGYTPDQLAYHQLVKMLCEDKKLELAIQICQEMRDRGFDWDLATGTMLIHLFGKMERFEEAFQLFEELIRRGVIPQYLTFCRLNDELKKHGMFKMAEKLCNMMASVPHSTGLPNNCRDVNGASQRVRRKSIVQKAEIMSEMLKTCNDRGGLVKQRRPVKDPVMSANKLIDEMKRRVSMLSEC